MKIALYIEDGLEQIVLTAESDTEKGILGKLHDGTRSLSVRRGSFYECQAGFVRQGAAFDQALRQLSDRRDDSAIIVLRPTKEAPPIA